jgi:hypothetical protein
MGSMFNGRGWGVLRLRSDQGDRRSSDAIHGFANKETMLKWAAFTTIIIETSTEPQHEGLGLGRTVDLEVSGQGSWVMDQQRQKHSPQLPSSSGMI